MIKRFFNKRKVFIPFIFIQVIIMILVILPVDMAFPLMLRENALTLVFIYIGFGLLFLATDNARLVLVSMLCAATLSLFIRNLNNQETNYLPQIENTEESVLNHNYPQTPQNSQKLINCKIPVGNGRIHH